ncbi:hypothetical protein [Dinoroseobacter sp. S76]|uniref:hypothetical protein n=1 Tax=Dinoroseobacter sp. S76 TaxID=3415124 RepID=UPI003C79845E
MIEETWWDYFDEDPYEEIGRQVSDCFGSPITVVLERISWAYVDWYGAYYDFDTNDFFRENHRGYRPSEGCLNAWFQKGIVKTFLDRERAGEPRPPWCPPAPEPYLVDM